MTVESGGKLIVFSGGTGIDFTVDSGGTAINSAGGSLDVVASATNSGVLVNAGIVNVQNGGTLTLDAATLITPAASIDGQLQPNDPVYSTQHDALRRRHGVDVR